MTLGGTAAAQTTVEYIHTDALGSVVAVTNEAGAVIRRYEYEPFGADMSPAEDGPGYAGHVRDTATGLTYMQQRYYDPMCGCFLSVDPVTAYDSGDYRHFNRYAYAFNNPYRFTDPDGRQSREFNFENQRLGVMPPPRAEGDWMGPAIGVALTAVLAAPVAAEIGIAALANPGAVATATSIAAEAAGVTGTATATVVTAAKISSSLVGSTMQTTQKAVSLPIVQKYVAALEGGSPAPAIKVADGVIVDGNHRYVAGRIAGQEPAVQPGLLSPSQVSQVKPIQEIKVDPKDWSQ
ncbi:RHS repeat domain-containing protein [Pseudoxanthomonas sp. UTMC 1351]|uniref:RHS repeat domain-containing protein n=1 Tax=Pseudoxanthomonas sp. UTMC 1351 TaxID=2695853 RepID=UPI0034CF47A6